MGMEARTGTDNVEGSPRPGKDVKRMVTVFCAISEPISGGGMRVVVA